MTSTFTPEALNVIPRTVKSAKIHKIWQKLIVARACQAVTGSEKTDSANRDAKALRAYETNCDLLLADHNFAGRLHFDVSKESLMTHCITKSSSRL
jgi:hypothetical protein